MIKRKKIFSAVLSAAVLVSSFVSLVPSAAVSNIADSYSCDFESGYNFGGSVNEQYISSRPEESQFAMMRTKDDNGNKVLELFYTNPYNAGTNYACGMALFSDGKSIAELTPGSSYTVSFEYKFISAPTEGNAWLAVTQGTESPKDTAWSRIRPLKNALDGKAYNETSNNKRVFHGLTKDNCTNLTDINGNKIASGEWNKFTYTFTAGDYGNNYIGLAASTAPGFSMYIDNISLTRNPVTVEDSYYFDFEDSKLNFKDLSNGTKVSTRPETSSYAMMKNTQDEDGNGVFEISYKAGINNAAYCVGTILFNDGTKALKLTEGAEYTVSLNYKLVNAPSVNDAAWLYLSQGTVDGDQKDWGNLKPAYNALDGKIHGDGGKRIISSLNSTNYSTVKDLNGSKVNSGKWNTFTYTFVAKNLGNNYLGLSACAVKDFVMYIDNISIAKTNTASIKTFDFEESFVTSGNVADGTRATSRTNGNKMNIWSVGEDGGNKVLKIKQETGSTDSYQAGVVLLNDGVHPYELIPGNKYTVSMRYKVLNGGTTNSGWLYFSQSPSILSTADGTWGLLKSEYNAFGGSHSEKSEKNCVLYNINYDSLNSKKLTDLNGNTVIPGEWITFTYTFTARDDISGNNYLALAACATTGSEIHIDDLSVVNRTAANVNKDSALDICDMVAADEKTAGSGAADGVFDLNGDGIVNAFDTAKLRKILLMF